MSTPAAQSVAVPPAAAPKRDDGAQAQSSADDHPLGFYSRLARRFLAERAAVASLVFLVLLVFVAVFAHLLAPYDPLSQDLRRALEGPSTEHLLGTDNLGRDTLSRLLFAARIALLGSAQAVSLALVIGVPLGLVVGYLGGWWDRIVMRITDAIIAIPGLIMAIAVIAILGPSLTNAMIAIGLTFYTSFLRLTRGVVLAIREEQYVEAATVVRLPTRRIIARHVLPNAAPPIIVQTSLAFGLALLAEAGLSFLGLGVQPPDASWGAMLSNASKFLQRQPFLMVPPGVAIMATVLAFNLVGDGLRDSLGRTSAQRSRADRRARSNTASNSVAAVAASTANGPQDDVVLRVQGLEVQFPSPRGEVMSVIEGVSFDVARGETVGLVGESGCGKTMTALAVMNLVPSPGRVVAGSVIFEGTDLLGLSPGAMNDIRGRHVSMVFQEPMSSLNPTFTIADQVGAPLRKHLGLTRRQARDRTIEFLDRVGIPEPAKRVDDYPHQLSGGMAQRVMIAMALACEPSLILADEPTTALDVTVQAQVLDLLMDLQAEFGTSIVFVTHDLGVVADICDRAVVMYAGQVIETASVDRLFTEPQHPYTEALLKSTPLNQARSGKLIEIPGHVPPSWAWPQGCRFHPRCAHAEERCSEPFEPVLTEVGLVRCVRTDELLLDGVTQ